MNPSLENFINDSKIKFGDRFSYEETIDTFVAKTKPCNMYCNIHKTIFTINTPSNHVRMESGGCGGCKDQRKSIVSKQNAAKRKEEKE